MIIVGTPDVGPVDPPPPALHRSWSESAWARCWHDAPKTGTSTLPVWLAPLQSCSVSRQAPSGATTTANDASKGQDDSLPLLLEAASTATTTIELRAWAGDTGLMGFVCADHQRGAALVRQLATTRGAGDRAHPAPGIQASAFAVERLIDVLMALVPETPERAARQPVTLPFDRAIALADGPIDEAAGLIADLTRGRLGSLDVRISSISASGPCQISIGSWLVTSGGLVHLHREGELLAHVPVSRDGVRVTLVAALAAGWSDHG